MATTLYLGNTSVTTPMSGDTSRNLQTSGGSSATYIQRSTSASGDHLLLSSTETSWWAIKVNAVTISGSISFNMWAVETNMSANVCIGVRIARYNSSGTFVSDVVANANANHKDNAEVAVDSTGNTPGVVTWTATPTSTSFSDGDWLVIEPHIDAIGTMAGGYTSRFYYNGSAAALAQSYVTFTETITENTGTQTVTLGLLDSSPAVYAPTVVRDEFIELGLLDAGAALYAPTVTGIGPTQSLTAPLLDGAPALYAPTLAPKNTLTLGLLDGAAALYAPTLAPKSTLTVPLLDASSALYAPTLLGKSTLTLGFLDASSALYAPTLAVGPVTVTLGLLDAVAELYAPTLAIAVAAQTITLPRITPPR